MEDSHFYLDNAPPEEVTLVLRALSPEMVLSIGQIALVLSREYGFEMQKDRTYSPRRLFDLGLAEQIRGASLSYRLTPLGQRVQSIQSLDPDLAVDLLHFLHFSGYQGTRSSRKYLWSYRRCVEHLWAASRLLPPSELAATVQGEMYETFPNIDFGARLGGRFDGTAVGRVYTWLRSLVPSPLPRAAGQSLEPRVVVRHELAALALSEVYRTRGYRYGDSVMLESSLIREVAGVFLLEHECCASLLHHSGRFTPKIVVSDTLAGPSVKLAGPFTVEDL